MTRQSLIQRAIGELFVGASLSPGIYYPRGLRRQSPFIALTAPSDGATITTQTTPFLAQASDPDGIARVEFYINGILVGTETSSPYGWGDDTPEYSLAGYSNGPLDFTAIAYDLGTPQRSSVASASCTYDYNVVPPGPGDPTAFGYRPELPSGWTLVENKALSQSDYDGKQRIMFRNCTGSVWCVNAATSDLIFVDCDLRSGTGGTWGKRISFYACRFGQGVDRDAVQIKPRTSGGARPEDWLFQGCTIRDITRASGSTVHTDGIQYGGILRSTVRHCYFDNIAVEMILCNGWNGNPEDVVVDRSYFGTRTSPGGPPIHFSTAGTYGAVNCQAIDNYYDGTVASIETGTVGCSQSGTRPRSDWPHTLRADGWLDY